MTSYAEMDAFELRTELDRHTRLALGFARELVQALEADEIVMVAALTDALKAQLALVEKCRRILTVEAA